MQITSSNVLATALEATYNQTINFLMSYPITTEAANPSASKDFFQSNYNLPYLAHEKLTGNEFLVYFALVQQMDNLSQVTKSLEELKAGCKIRSRTTIIKAIDGLVAMGMVRRLGNRSEGYTYQITQVEDWVDRPQTSSSKSGLTSIKAKACKVLKQVVQKLDNYDVQKLNNEEIEQPTSSNTPPKGGVAEVVVVQKLNNKSDVQDLNNDQDLNNADLDDKLAAARERGWTNSGTWLNELGERMVTVNSFVVRLEEFMKRSLDSFHHIQENWEAGLDLCRQQIERIKQRSCLSYG